MAKVIVQLEDGKVFGELQVTELDRSAFDAFIFEFRILVKRAIRIEGVRHRARLCSLVEPDETESYNWGDR